jgi:WD40 repeat protein
VFVWSLANGQLNMKRSPVVSPDGLLRADFENDEVIGLRHNKTGGVIAALHGPIRAVTDMQFSPDSKLLVSSSADGTIQVWDATVTKDSAPIVTLKGHNGGVTSVAFNADGTRIASTGYDGTVRLWGIKS